MKVTNQYSYQQIAEKRQRRKGKRKSRFKVRPQDAGTDIAAEQKRHGSDNVRVIQ